MTRHEWLFRRVGGLWADVQTTLLGKVHLGEDGRGIYLLVTSCLSLINVCPWDMNPWHFQDQVPDSSPATGEKPPSTQPSASPGCRDGRRGSLDGSGTMGSGSHSARGCLRGGVGRASRGRGADVTARGVGGGEGSTGRRVWGCASRRHRSGSQWGAEHIQESAFTDPTPPTGGAPRILSPLTTNSRMLRTRCPTVFPRQKVQVQCA